MKLSIENIGKIKQACVEINGITVIAGENNTGKSTVGKTLFSVFNSFYNIEEQIRNEKIQSVEYILGNIYRHVTSRLTSRVDFEDIANNIIDSVKKSDNENILRDKIISEIVQYDEYFTKFNEVAKIDEFVSRVHDVILVSDEDVFKAILDKKLQAEFYGQVNNIYTKNDAKISLQIRNDVVNICIKDDEINVISNKLDLKTEVVYFDDPFILDEQRIFSMYKFPLSYMDHRTHLKYKLYAKAKETNVIDEIVATNKFKKIYDKISNICEGNIVRGKSRGWGYKKPNTDKVLDIRNLSSGLKTFVILKQLLENGTIEYNGTIVLDEPEVHLHPEWQLYFAELIVLIQKEFGVHVLLNTHSPYFLNAIEVYSVKHGVKDKCKYYLTEMNGESSCLEDVTDNVEAIYSKLARPLQDLENERYRYD